MLAGLAAGAQGALPAFDISPASLTLQAGDTATGTLSNLPAPTDGRLGCLGATGTVPNYLTIAFSVPCESQMGWSSSMTIKTIPATPAGTYTIVFQVCPTACYLSPDIRNEPPIATRNWTVVVTAAPVPVETVPNPASPSPAPAPQAPHPAPTASRSVPRTVPTTATSPSGTQTPPVAPTPAPGLSPGLSPGPSPAAAPGGVAPGLVLDHPVLKAGQTLRVSGTGCVPGAPATVALPGFVTGTTTAGPDGAVEVSLRVPSSLRAGRYPVVAQCGTTLSSLVDVQRSRSIRTAALVALAIVAILLAAAALSRRKPRKPPAP
jgi:hypothetical protein